MQKYKLCDVPKWDVTSGKKREYKEKLLFNGNQLIIKWKEQLYEKKILQLKFRGMKNIKAEEINREEFITNCKPRMQPR